MNNLREIIQFFDMNDPDVKIQEIQKFAKYLTAEYGENAELIFLDSIEKIKTFQKLLEHFYELKFKQSTANSDKATSKESQDSGKPKLSFNFPTTNESHISVTEEPKIQRDHGDINFATEILPYKKSYIREMCRKDKIPHSKPNGKFVFCRKDLEDWLNKNGSEHKKELLKIGKQVKLPQSKN